MMIDPNNPIIQLLKIFGCDLTKEIVTKYDLATLGMAFGFACLCAYWFFKMGFAMYRDFISGRMFR